MTQQTRNLDCDLLVIGGGAAGLSGAVTAAYHGLKVIVAEKAPVLGGSTSWSGGWMWAPLNPLSQADGIVEDIDAPRTYLKHALGANYDEPRVEALLDNARRMVAFFENHTALQFVSGSWIADIQGDLPGAGTGGRSVGPEADQHAADREGLRAKLRPQLYETSFLGLGIMAGPDLQAFLHATTSVKGFFHAGWRVAFHVFDLVTNRQGMQLVNGTALIARLAKSADDLGVPLLVNTPVTRLLTEDGAVTGAVLAGSDGEITVRARRGVLLAAGGFPTTSHVVAQLFPRTPTGREHWTLAPPETTGDGVSLGESVGGVFDTSLASPAAWCPVSLVPYRSGRVGTYPHIVDRGKPGLIAVLSNGKRFVNEADGYYQFTSAMIAAAPEGEEVAAWLICDHAFQRRYPFGMSKPFPVPVWPYLSVGIPQAGPDPGGPRARSAASIPLNLAATVAAFNKHARVGEDPEFDRGSPAFNRGSGDPEHGPNPSLAPIEKGPFYAIKVLPGSFGTFAGLKTDPLSRVLNGDGEPIPGLYAAGSDQANVMGGHYPSGGINIGPAMTFGYIAGRHAAGATDYETSYPGP